ncbi:MAG: YqeG family HAD IIIA-type phosphatase [Ruminococcaceae bacterium]|nr:YqeG family HAD IIIA-type phosphatase [Oscillospiraceae bacterium]
MAKIFTPDYMFATYRDVTPEFLQSIGIKALLIDIDNTLAPYEQPLPDENIKAWFKALDENGIKAAFVSNNERERVDLFNSEIGIPAFYKSGKPFSKNLYKAMAQLGSDVSNTAMLGDQLLTDASAGNNIKLRTVIVPPIKDKNNFFFRSKRRIEVPTIKKFVKKNGEEYREICSFWLEKKYRKNYKG